MFLVSTSAILSVLMSFCPVKGHFFVILGAEKYMLKMAQNPEWAKLANLGQNEVKISSRSYTVNGAHIKSMVYIAKMHIPFSS